MVKFEREVERYHRVYILITVRGNLFIIEILKSKFRIAYLNDSVTVRCIKYKTNLFVKI